MEQYKDIVIRIYESGDAEKIYSLFSKHTTYTRDDKFWVWINRIICDQSIIVVAVHNDMIVGHYAIVPREIIIDGNTYNAGLGIHAFVAPEYREVVSIYSISRLAYQIAKEKNILLIYGFPNTNYRLIQEKIERWNRVALFNAMELNVNDIVPVTDPHALKIEEIDRIDFSDLFAIQEFLEKNTTSKVQLLSNARYWLERYFLHPQKLYQILKFVTTGKTIGFLVCKRYSKNGTNYLHIIDYVLLEDCYTAGVLQSFLTYSQSRADIISVWKGNESFQNELMKVGFQETGFDTFLGVKFLDKKNNSDIQETVLNFNNWRLVPGDSDAF